MKTVSWKYQVLGASLGLLVMLAPSQAAEYAIQGDPDRGLTSTRS